MPFRVLWNASPDAMVLTDSVGLVLAANPAYCALHGYLSNHLDGQSIAVIFPEAARPDAMSRYQAVFASRDNHPELYPAITQMRDRSESLVESRIDFLRQSNGQSVMMSSVRLLPEERTARSPNPQLDAAPALDDIPTAAELLIDAIRIWGIGIVFGANTPGQHLAGTEDLPPL